MSIIDLGKNSGTSNAVLTPEQRQDIAQKTAFSGDILLPAYKSLIGNTISTYNAGAPGVENAAQNLDSVGSQAQRTFGETGESALRTGVAGMESLFSPDYEANQIATALQPAQAQYMQNVANQEAQFGGAGELGSARQALAGRQLAGSTMATQAATAAQVMKDIMAQRAATGANLANLGQTGLTNAISAAGVPLSASQASMDYANKIIAGITGVPTGTVTPNFAGTQGSTKTGSSFGLSL